MSVICGSWACVTACAASGCKSGRTTDRSIPGFYDLTATGHMDPGETPLTAALREAREEIGLHADEADVTPGGSYRQRYYRAGRRL